MLFLAFGHAMNASMVSRDDFRECANPTCKHLFAPLRKSASGSPAYCTPRCARIVAARNYRKKKAAARKAMKAKKKTIREAKKKRGGK
jgi:hypothetical protein